MKKIHYFMLVLNDFVVFFLWNHGTNLNVFFIIILSVSVCVVVAEYTAIGSISFTQAEFQAY